MARPGRIPLLIVAAVSEDSQPHLLLRRQGIPHM